jgi:hypothetical protein
VYGNPSDERTAAAASDTGGDGAFLVLNDDDNADVDGSNDDDEDDDVDRDGDVADNIVHESVDSGTDDDCKEAIGNRNAYIKR